MTVGGKKGFSRDIKISVLAKLEPSLDPTCTYHLGPKELDALVYVMTKIRPDAKVADLGIANSRISKVIELFKQARQRVEAKSTTGKLMGLNDSLTNIMEIATAIGWDDEWFEPVAKKAKQTAKNKGKAVLDRCPRTHVNMFTHPHIICAKLPPPLTGRLL